MAVAISMQDGIGIITLNRPEKRNAFNKNMFMEVTNAVNYLCSKATGLVLTGNKYFSAGLDLVEIYGFTSVEQARQYFNELINMINSFTRCERPVVALVNDSAYGFSVELLYFMDRVIALRSVQFSLPGIKYGIVPVTPAFAPYLGIRARAFMDPGFIMTTQDAYDLGLINEVVDTIDEGFKAALNAVKRLASIPGSAFKLYKSFIIGNALRNIMENEDKLLNELARYVTSEEAKNRLRNFAERKKA